MVGVRILSFEWYEHIFCGEGQCRQAQVWSSAQGSPMVSVELVHDASIANHEQSTLVRAIDAIIDGSRRP